jgi:hypothetical protein
MEAITEDVPKALLPYRVQDEYARAQENNVQQVADEERFGLKDFLQWSEVDYQQLAYD